MSTGGARIPADRFGERLARVQTESTEQPVRAVLVGVGADLEWLIGYAATGLERLNLLIVPAHGRPKLIVPRLEVSAAQVASGVATGAVDLAIWQEQDDPFALAGTLLEGDAGLFLVSDGLRAAFLLRLEAAITGARFAVASALLGPLRRTKDVDEVTLLRAAAAAADRTLEAVLSGPLVGRTEADVAREVRERLVDEGHDLAAFAIVASGPNSASPHHEPSGREIAAGEPLLLDIGGRLGGYCSDTTRTVWIDGGDPGLGPDDTFRQLYGLVEEAQAVGRAAVSPGRALGDIDHAARSIIENGGYGERFFHRLGHGIGLEVHEEPYVVGGNSAPVLVGDAISIEPGIYLEGRYGARIEDIVVCTAEGGDVLNRAPRTLRVVSG